MASIMSTSTPDSRPRKRVSQACQPCGLKKVKCDGIQPICTPCASKGVQCTYGVSKRRTRDNMASPRPRSSLPPQSMLPRDEPGSANSQYSQHPIDPYHTPREYKPHAQRYYAAVSSDTSAKLFQTYFASIHPIWPILYKPSYAALDHSSPTATMPAALIAAIYCIASSVERPSQSSSSAILHRYSEPQQFFDEALDLIQQDSNQGEHAVNTFTPSITNCQVLAILALQQHGVAEYARASMLCGLASAMAIELRLHRPSSPNNTVQAEVRSRLWWNLFILEHKLSCEMAHPAILRIEETDTPFPSVSEADEFELLFVPTPSHQDRGISVKARTISVLETTIQLSIITERISREVYSLSARKAIRHDSKLGQQKRMDLWGVIQNWERDVMASPLRLDLSESFASIPGTVINHVIMWHSTILLHRPFISRSQPPAGSSDSSEEPLMVCHQAATNICLVLEKYFGRLHGLPCELVFSIFTAATIFLYHSQKSDGEARVASEQQVKLCAHWLSVLGKSWKGTGAQQQLHLDPFESSRTHGHANGQSSQAKQDYSAPPSMGPNSGFAPNSLYTQDWGFLQHFGDLTDDFYYFDLQLVNFLEGKSGAEPGGFS